MHAGAVLFVICLRRQLDVVVCFGAVVCELLIFFVAVLLSFPVVVCFCLWRLVVLFLADRARIKKTPFSFFFLPSFVGSHLFSFKIKIGIALCLQARQRMDKQQEEESSKNQNFEKAFFVFRRVVVFSPRDKTQARKFLSLMLILNEGKGCLGDVR